MTFQSDVTQFHRAFGAPVADAPKRLPLARADLRIALIDEERNELVEAICARDLVATADAVADLLYVVVGLAVECGIPVQAVWDEVHRSNMSKLGPDGKPIYREDGKVLKGPHYSPPDVMGAIVRGATTMASERSLDTHYAAKIRALDEDPESDHVEADRIVAEALRCVGLFEAAAAYEEKPKWYA